MLYNLSFTLLLLQEQKIGKKFHKTCGSCSLFLFFTNICLLDFIVLKWSVVKILLKLTFILLYAIVQSNCSSLVTAATSDAVKTLTLTKKFHLMNKIKM